MKRRVFVSDIHMSQGLSLKKPIGCYDWFDTMEADLFLDFLNHIATGEVGPVDELILLGDILDNWIFPMTDQPPDFSLIAKAPKSKQILDKLGAISETRTVIYVPGNHDMTVANKSVFEDGGYKNIIFEDPYETTDGLYAEHGHRFCMYNAVDPDYGLPLGYYISRLQATVDAGTGKPPKRWQETLGGLLNALITPSFNPYVDAPLNYFCGQLKGLSDTEPPFIVENGTAVELGKIREKYADLPDRWVRRHGPMAPAESALQETPYGLVNQAEALAREMGKKVVVFGHTHGPTINYFWTQKMGILPDNPESVAVAIYANCGCWCQGDLKGTYVEDDCDDSGKHVVTLKSWPSGKPLDGTSPLSI